MSWVSMAASIGFIVAMALTVIANILDWLDN